MQTKLWMDGFHEECTLNPWDGRYCGAPHMSQAVHIPGNSGSSCSSSLTLCSVFPVQCACWSPAEFRCFTSPGFVTASAILSPSIVLPFLSYCEQEQCDACRSRGFREDGVDPVPRRVTREYLPDSLGKPCLPVETEDLPALLLI